MISPPVTDCMSRAERAHTFKAAAMMALLLVLAGLIAWAMWRRGKVFGHENGAAWKYQPAEAADPSHPVPAKPDGNAGNAIPPPNTVWLPDPTAAATPNLPSTRLKKPNPAVRLTLARPIPDEARTEATPRRHKRHRRDLLGLGKLWHWIRRDHHKKLE